MANRAFKFKIFPTAEQKNLIDKTIGCSRFIYNQMLNDKIKYYELNKQMLYNTPAQYKSEFEFLKEVDSVALANVQLNLEKAFKGFFTQPNIGFPKFKTKKRSKLRYTTNYNNGKSNLLVDQNKLKLPKVGLVDIDIYRNIPENYQFRSATIEHLPTDEYYVSILFEYEQIIPNISLDKSNSLGLDYSSPDFYVDSNNNKPEKIKYYRQSEQQLAKEQHKLANMELNSNNYKKQKIKIAKIHKHIKNQRLDFIHKLSTDLANNYDYICVEDLNLRNTAQTLRLGKSTNDNGFGLFRSCLAYKLADRGKKLIKVSKWYASSKICHHCGSKNTELTLKDRTWFCKECWCLIERDYNAAQNILDEGLKQV